MSKYINAVKAAEIVSKRTKLGLGNLIDLFCAFASEDIQPVVHAHWILLSGGVARCSNCNRCVGSWDYDNTDNYCRVCGAMMDEESEAG